MTEIKFTPAQDQWLEVTWAEVTQLPDVVTPAKPALFDAEGNEVQAAQPETTTPGGTERKELKHTSYHPTQLDLLRADAEMMSTPLDDHMNMLNAWVASYVPPPALPLTFEDFERALTTHLDATAQQRRYDSRVTCALRAGYDGPFRAEGQAFASWMDACNAFGYKFLAEVQAGTRPMPSSTQELIDLMPPMVWPGTATV